ncbi:MAG: RHS repeat-associated core domain-containing protein, partial [Acidobacteria bacterium]|nr:RHS repeat-associated core domain-containing protein [Acidobacteriota bacterium]
YDTQGRLSGNTQTTTGLTGGKALSYTFNADDTLASVTYPSLLRTTTCYDTLGRVKWLTGATGTVTCTDAVGPAGSYVQSASYTYTGTEMASVITLGNNLVETLTQNMRGQLTDVQLEPLWRLVNAYGTTNNNGNVQSQTLTVGTAPALTTNYTYDMLIRLTQASETANAPNTGWTEAYGYDRYGNRWLSSHAGLPAPATNDVPETQGRYGTVPNNRIDKDVFPANHDNAGRLLAWSGQTIGYDGEDRMVAAGSISFSYDGEGRRVKKVAGTETTVYVYDAFGQLAAEYSTVAPAESGRRYVTADHLGSTRAITDTSATPVLTSCLDYLPFGGLVPVGTNGRSVAPCYAAANSLKVKFTGKERDLIGLDDSSGLDYFGARYFSGAQGRFTSPDPLMASAHVLNPQTWNRYSYALNNPLRITDPEGLYPSPTYACDKEHTECLNATQRALLERSTITDKKGNKLTGEAAYRSLSEKQQNAFVNVTDRLASMKLSDGTTALSKVGSLTAIETDRIKGSVDSSLGSLIQSDDRFHSASGALHPGFDTASFKSKDVELNVQFSFGPGMKVADIDQDLYQDWRHGWEVVSNHATFTTTSQDTVRKMMIARPEIGLTPSTDSKWNRPPQ